MQYHLQNYEKKISNKLANVLPRLISPQQCAFIQGRTASNNALIGLEFFHNISKSASNPTTLKLDLSKAFDRVKWKLISYFLRWMAFRPDLIYINQCITTNHIGIKFNGFRTSYFKPSRGLRQGDPLSPLLFIICMESLTALNKKAWEDKLWVSAFPKKQIMDITHLMYADDVILFTKCSHQGLTSIQSVIHTFCQATGQFVNYSKSSLIFSKSATPLHKQAVCSFLQIPEASNDLIYLGMRLPFGRSKSQLFQYLISRIRKKTESWKSNNLSRVGKTAMIKSVIQSLPIHVMSCATNCPSKFVISWEDLCKQKLRGGLGLKGFYSLPSIPFGQASLEAYYSAWIILSSVLQADLLSKYFLAICPDSKKLFLYLEEHSLGQISSWSWVRLEDREWWYL